MLTLNSTELARLSAAVAGVVYLVELDFIVAGLPVVQRFTTFNLELTVGGQAYMALGTLAAVGDLHESQDTDTQTLNLSLSVANAAVLASVLGNVEGYRGRQARIYLLLLDENYRPVGTPRLRFAGEMEPVRVARDSPGPGGGPVGGKIDLPVSRAGMSRARNYDGLRLTDEQQRAEYPADRGLEYVRTLIEKPTLWLSKRFQEQ
jgi:hypothetical protein